MDIGFYDELKELQEEDDLADFGFLENEQVTSEKNAFDFLHGFCDEFAAFLSDVYGYEIESVRHWEIDGFTGKLIHTYCIAEIHDEIAYIDIRGITTNPQLFFQEFENEVTFYPDNYELWDLEGEATVERWLNKDTLFDGDYEGWSDEMIYKFIVEHDDYFNVKRLEKKLSLDMQIEQACARSQNISELKNSRMQEKEIVS